MNTYKWEPDAAEKVRSAAIRLLARVRALLLIAFWMILALLLVKTSYFTVPADSVAVVQRFGKSIGTREPGLHFRIPFGVDKVTAVPVRRQLKLVRSAAIRLLARVRVRHTASHESISRQSPSGPGTGHGDRRLKRGAG